MLRTIGVVLTIIVVGGLAMAWNGSRHGEQAMAPDPLPAAEPSEPAASTGPLTPQQQQFIDRFMYNGRFIYSDSD